MTSRADPVRDRRWTPRQREVLDLLARGRTNGQIAEELGISLDGAKWHVGEIITKLDFDTREEAAEYWRQQRGLPARLRLLTRTGSLPAAMRWLALGGAGLAAAAVVGITAFALWNGGDEQAAPDTTPTPVATVTASPGETPTAIPTGGNATEGPLTEIAGAAVRDLAIGEERPLPAGVLLYYNVTCYRCGGGWDLHRAYQSEQGLVTERVDHGLPPAEGGLNSFLILPGVTEMVASLCNPGFCNGETGFSPGAVVHTYSSTDGGLTWDEWEPALPFGSRVIGRIGDQWFIWSSDDGGFELSGRRYWLYPSGQEIEPPAPNTFPSFTNQGDLIWSPQVDPQMPAQVDAAGKPLPGRDLDPDIIAGFAAGDIDGRAYYLAIARQDYSLRRGSGNYLVTTEGDEASAAYRWPYTSLRIVDELGERLLVGDALYPDGQPDSQVPDFEDFDYRAVLIDLESSSLHSIAGLPRTFSTDGNRFSYPQEIVARGGVLRVATDGSCLNVRTEPAMDAESLRCYVDGVLLFERESSDVSDGWVAVTTPDRRAGWASAEFLER